MIKRVFDFAAALAALLVLLLPLLVLSILVRRRLGTPVFFRQTRPGLGGRPFEMLKFRTMNDERDAAGVLKPDSERLTDFGSNVECLAENKVGATATNITIPGLVVYTYT